MRHLLLCLFLGSFVSFLPAQTGTPAGRWKTVDDNTGETRSVVKIYQINGVYFADIEKLIVKPGQNPTPRCSECKGDKKDKPVVGMNIMWGVTRDGDDYSGGTILDPDNGNTYRVRLRVSPDGSRLTVRGYIGISLLGRSQIWHRAD